MLKSIQRFDNGDSKLIKTRLDKWGKFRLKLIFLGVYCGATQCSLIIDIMRLLIDAKAVKKAWRSQIKKEWYLINKKEKMLKVHNESTQRDLSYPVH